MREDRSHHFIHQFAAMPEERLAELAAEAHSLSEEARLALETVAKQRGATLDDLRLLHLAGLHADAQIASKKAKRGSDKRARIDERIELVIAVCALVGTALVIGLSIAASELKGLLAAVVVACVAGWRVVKILGAQRDRTRTD